MQSATRPTALGTTVPEPSRPRRAGDLVASTPRPQSTTLSPFDLRRQRAELMGRLRTTEWEFDRRPTQLNLERLRMLREVIGLIEEQLVAATA